MSLIRTVKGTTSSKTISGWSLFLQNGANSIKKLQNHTSNKDNTVIEMKYNKIKYTQESNPKPERTPYN